MTNLVAFPLPAAATTQVRATLRRRDEAWAPLDAAATDAIARAFTRALDERPSRLADGSYEVALTASIFHDTRALNVAYAVLNLTQLDVVRGSAERALDAVEKRLVDVGYDVRSRDVHVDGNCVWARLTVRWLPPTEP